MRHLRKLLPKTNSDPKITIDDPVQVKTLLEKMEHHLPIPAQIRSGPAQQLKAQGKNISPHRQVSIQSVLNSGDEGGILCTISPPGSKEVLLISLTHLKIPYHHPLEKEIRAYQKARIRKLSEAGE